MAKIRREARECVARCRNGAVLRRLAFLSVVYTSIKCRVFRTARGIYYDHVEIFKTQKCILRLAKLYTKRFSCERHDLFIKASLKGVFEGSLVFNVSDSSAITPVEMRGKNLIPDMTTVVSIRHSVKRVLVIEKDSVFSALADPSLILVCGKGYPCWNTLALLEMLEKTAEILCMTDFDPYGIDIFMVYRRRVHTMRRIGLCADDLFRFGIDASSCIRLSSYDLHILERLEKLTIADRAMHAEVRFIQGLCCKLELECLVWNDEFRVAEYINHRLGRALRNPAAKLGRWHANNSPQAGRCRTEVAPSSPN